MNGDFQDIMESKNKSQHFYANKTGDCVSTYLKMFLLFSRQNLFFLSLGSFFQVEAREKFD